MRKGSFSRFNADINFSDLISIYNTCTYSRVASLTCIALALTKELFTVENSHATRWYKT